jgi:carbon monoxide dehydrogenase subunit G
MRFDGSRVIESPLAAVWYALRNPDTLEVIIPRCARIERQPGYRPESSSDFTLSFESAASTQTPSAGAVIGWLEVDRQRPPHHLSLTLTLNDALTFMHIEGTIDLTARNQGRATELHYSVDAKVPGLRGVGWSAHAHDETERLIASMLNELARLLGTTMESSLGYVNGYVTPTDQPQVLLETQRGSVVLLPATEVPAPTQGMLRRVQRQQMRRVARQQRQFAAAIALSSAAVLSAAVAAWGWARHVRSLRAKD